MLFWIKMILLAVIVPTTLSYLFVAFVEFNWMFIVEGEPRSRLAFVLTSIMLAVLSALIWIKIDEEV